MTVFQSTGGPSSAVVTGGLQPKQNPSILNVAIPTAGTEVLVSLPAGTKGFRLRSRDIAVLEIRTVSAGPYFELRPGCVLSEQELDLPVITNIYVTSNVGSSVVELWVWT